MKGKSPVRRRRLASLHELRRRPAKAKGTLRATRSGELDVSVKGADHSYRVIVEEMQAGAVTLTHNGLILYCNRCFADLVKVPLRQLIGANIRVCLPFAEHKRLRALLHCSTPRIGRAEMLFRTKEGASVPCMVSAVPLELKGVDAVCLVVTDLTAQKRCEDTLRLMIENTQDYSFYLIDPHGIVTTWTEAAERMYGYTAREIIGQRFTLLRGDDREAARAARQALRVATKTGHCEESGWRLRRDGTKFKVNVLTAALRNADGTVHGFSRLSHDVTEQHRLEQEILEAGAREQRRIGLDLHDNLGQQLTGIAYLIETLGLKLPAHSTAAAQLARIQYLVSKALQHTRTLAHGLCPVELRSRNLGAALRQFADNVEKLYDIRCRVRLRRIYLGNNHNLAPTQIYHILQEAVTNSIKHGKATRIQISLGSADGTTTLTIKDNGVGLRDRSESSGIGLQTMEYRARLIGGSLDVRSSPGGGTTVRCSFNPREVNMIKLAPQPKPARRLALPLAFIPF